MTPDERRNDVNDADRARALADRFWEELLEREPVFATAIGDERYDDRLPDIGAEGRARAETRNRAALDELASIDRAGLVQTVWNGLYSPTCSPISPDSAFTR